jgi:hypothetical protein
VIEADGTPAVAVTEGLLAEFARDELEILQILVEQAKAR